MLLKKDGTWVEFETEIGEFSFTDANGQHRGAVNTDGEFWRVVCVTLPRAALTPQAARDLAKLLVQAAAVAEKEEKKRAAIMERLCSKHARCVEPAGHPGGCTSAGGVYLKCAVKKS